MLFLGREVVDDTHLFLVRKVVISISTFDAYGGEMLPAKRRKQEEIDHPVFVRTEFGVGHIDLQNPLLGIFYGLFEGDFPVALVLLFEFFHGRKSLLRRGVRRFEITQSNIVVVDTEIVCHFACGDRSRIISHSSV